jgi:hypothetical protein
MFGGMSSYGLGLVAMDKDEIIGEGESLHSFPRGLHRIPYHFIVFDLSLNYTLIFSSVLF